jgi:small subunit ribosomal protein S21
MSEVDGNKKEIINMLKVQVKDSVSIDKALKILKKKVKETKQNEILKDRKEFKKKSVKRRDEIKKASFHQKVKTEREKR